METFKTNNFFDGTNCRARTNDEWRTTRTNIISSLAFHIETVHGEMSSIIFDIARLCARFPRSYLNRFNIEFEIRESEIIIFFSRYQSFRWKNVTFQTKRKLVAFATDNTDTGHMFDWNVTYDICINVFNFALQIVSFESIVGISW